MVFRLRFFNLPFAALLALAMAAFAGPNLPKTPSSAVEKGHVPKYLRLRSAHSAFDPLRQPRPCRPADQPRCEATGIPGACGRRAERVGRAAR